MTLRPILIAEDDPADLELTMEALREHKLANPILVARDGAEALACLRREGEWAVRSADLPLVLLLDLKMPRVDGLEVLRAVRADPALRRLPIVMLTSSREESDLVRSYDLGVNAYVVKPVDFAEFLEAVRRLGTFWALVNEAPPGAA